MNNHTNVDFELNNIIESNYTFGIIGLGVENKTFLRWLIKTINIDPKRIYLGDRFEPKSSDDLPCKLHEFGGTFFGDHYLDICSSDIKHIFKAPGIWSLKREFVDFRSKHGQNSIHSSLVFFLQRYREQIIGVTGTKGKSTTSSLITYILGQKEFIKEYHTKHQADPKVHYTGNSTNTSPYDYWNDFEKGNKHVDPHTYYVIELSSFQLQDLNYDAISPARSIITNYYIDHQDQHASVEEYWSAKNTIFKHQNDQDFLIASDQIEDKIEPNRFKQHVEWIDGEFANVLTANLDHKLIGMHNNINSALAITAAVSLIDTNSSPKTSLKDTALEFVQAYPKLIQQFVPLRHRLEIVGKKFSNIQLTLNNQTKTIPCTLVGINDSQGTMPEASIAGIKALTHKPNEYLWMIVSGTDKGVEVEDLCREILKTQISHQLFRIDYYGAIGHKVLATMYSIMGAHQQSLPPIELIKEHFALEIKPIEKVIQSFESWLQHQINEAYDIENSELINKFNAMENVTLNIALLPCGASFDEFSNYSERGEWFGEQIQKGFEQ